MARYKPYDLHQAKMIPLSYADLKELRAAARRGPCSARQVIIDFVCRGTADAFRAGRLTYLE